MVATLDMLKEQGCSEIRVLVLVAAPEGVKRVLDAHPDVTIFCCWARSVLKRTWLYFTGSWRRR